MVASRKLPGNRLALLVSAASLYLCAQGLLTVLALELPHYLAKAGHWQFLTNLSLAVSILVFAVNVLAQLTKNIHIFHVKNELHAIAFTLESIVALVYWPMRLFFLDAIKIKASRLIPLSLDLTIHLLPVVSLAIDYYFFMPQWRIKNSHAYVTCIVLGVSYWFYLENLMDETSLYPYPFLEVETRPRISIFALIVHVSFGNFFLQRKLHDAIIGKEVDDTYDKDK